MSTMQPFSLEQMFDPSRPYCLGILVPSSNTRLEPAIQSILEKITSNDGLPIKVSAHYTRVRVIQVTTSQSSAAQFDLENMLQAASLLVDAGVDAMAWAGTSASWTGIQNDRAFCSAIIERFGIPATTSTSALLEYMHKHTNEELLLVIPYVQDMNNAIRANFAKEGIEVVDDRCLSITENREIGQVTDRQIKRMVDDVTRHNPDVETVVVLCTNLFTGDQLETWESEGEYTIVDSIVVTLWALLGKVGLGSVVQSCMIHRYHGKMLSALR